MSKLWTAIQDDRLRQLHATGASDKQIAREMGYGASTVYRKRRGLGLKAQGKGGGKGWKQRPETRAKISAAVRRRWQEPEYRTLMRPVLKRMVESSMASRYRIPSLNTKEGRYYRKLCREIGVEKARAAFVSTVIT